MSLLQPITKPSPPDLIEGDVQIEDMINWYEEWVERMTRAFQESEADKQAIREWSGLDE